MSASNYDLQVDIARQLFLTYDQELLIRKFRLKADKQWLYLRYLSREHRISRSTGKIEERLSDGWWECRDYGTVMTVCDLLCFSPGERLPALANTWCSVGTFVVTGITETEDFTRRYANVFAGRPEKLRAACVALGGQLLPPMAGADLTCRFSVTSFFPVLLQFWEGDEEFPPKLLVLWDRNTDKFMHFETTFYLQGDLLCRLKEKLPGDTGAAAASK